MFSRESGGRSCTRDVTQPQIYVRPKPEKNEDTPTVCRVAKTPFSYTTQNTSKLKNQRFRFIGRFLHNAHITNSLLLLQLRPNPNP